MTDLKYRKIILDNYHSVAYKYNHSEGTKSILKKDDEKSNITFFKYNFLKHLPVDKNVKFLELGPGAGQFMQFLRINGYQNIKGIDGSSEMVLECQKKSLDVSRVDDFVEYLSKEINENSIDVVIANDILEHFTKGELVEILIQIKKCLKAGGCVIAKVPNASACFTAGYGRFCDLTHELIFTELSVRQLFYSLGYTKVSIFVPNNFCFYLNPLNYLGWFANFLLKWIQILIFRISGNFDVNVVSSNMIIKVLK